MEINSISNIHIFLLNFNSFLGIFCVCRGGGGLRPSLRFGAPSVLPYDHMMIIDIIYFAWIFFMLFPS